MSSRPPRAACRIQDALSEAGVASPVIGLSDSTRTAREAAMAIGCTVSQIAKSLVFRSASGDSVLVIASGANRVNEERITHFVGEPVERAAAEFVRETSGYAIGGVPPFGHRQQPKVVLVDADLMQHSEIWAAAGTPHAVVRLTPDQLVRLSSGRVVHVKE